MKMLKKCFILLLAVAFMAGMSNFAFATDTQKININTATVKELVKLKRIGPKYAERIIKYREENGPFKIPEDIMKVKGIGPKTFEANKDIITVQ